MSCVVQGCKSHSGRKDSSEVVTFHRFPKDEKIKQEWIERVSRPHWTVGHHNRICSKHFTPDSFLPDVNIKWRRLKHNALPTLYLSNYESKIADMDVSGISEQIKVEPSTTTLAHLDELEAQGTCRSLEVHMGKGLCVKEEVRVSSFAATQPQFCKLDAQETCRDPLMQLNITTLGPNKIKEEEDISAAISSGGCRCSANDDCLLKVAEYEKRNQNLQRDFERLKEVSKRRLKKIHVLKRQFSRLEKKNVNLYNLLLDRMKEEDMEKDYLTILEHIDKHDIIKRVLQKEAGHELAREYSKEIKEFSVTLNNLSPKAYLFVREKFKDVLPHPKTISAWYKGVDGKPGFT